MDEGSQDYLITPAWLLVGIFDSIPGALGLVGERLTFTIKEGLIIDTTLPEIKDLTFPWYYFGAGLKFRSGSEKYRISLTPLSKGEYAAMEGLQDVVEGRKYGKAWKAKLRVQ